MCIIPQNGLDHTADFTVSEHFKDQMELKGFTAEQVANAIYAPEKVTEVRKYPGQRRYCGDGVAVIVRPERVGYTLITLYADGIITPLREDQKNDPDALHSRRLNGVR